jgi:hypothetical protein
MFEFLKNYGLAIFHYWWLTLFGAPQIFNNVWKWFHPERKDAPIPHWLRVTFGVLAIVIAQGIVYRDSLKNLDTVIEEKKDVVSENWHLKHPDTPAVAAVAAICPVAKAKPQPSKQAAPSSHGTSTSQQAPASTSIPPVQYAQQTQQERVTQINKNLSTGDRERLSNVLYEFSQMLEKMTTLGYKANQEIAQIGNEVSNGSIVKSYEVRTKKLREIGASGNEFAKSFALSREAEKWKYYSDQRDYVFGDNPDNLGPNAIISAAESYANSLDQWSLIKDRENKSALNLLAMPRVESDRSLRTFFDWSRGCETRLEQMKQSIR